jgi:multiple sugar transport system permease protein
MGIAAFFLAPLAIVVWLITQSWNLLGEPQFIGGSNLAQVGDPRFLSSLGTTATIGALALAVELGGGFLLAQVLVRGGLVQRFTMVVILLPWMAAPLVIGVVARWVLAPSGGVLAIMTGERTAALTEPWSALVVIALVVAWQGTGFAALVYTASLGAIPDELRAAAALDGLTSWQRSWHIDWPLVAPATAFLAAAGIAQALGLYDLVVPLTGGGPGTSTETVAMRIVHTAWEAFDVGGASAFAVVVCIVGAAASAVVLRRLRSRT